MAQITIAMCDQIQDTIRQGHMATLTQWELYQLAHIAKVVLSNDTLKMMQEGASLSQPFDSGDYTKRSVFSFLVTDLLPRGEESDTDWLGSFKKVGQHPQEGQSCAVGGEGRASCTPQGLALGGGGDDRVDLDNDLLVGKQ